MKPDPAPRNDSARSPFAGCLILVIAVAVMAFLIAFSTLTLFRQAAAIAAFTDETPATIAVEPLDDREAELNALAERLETFRQQLDGTEATSISFTADELNLAIATYDEFKELRGTFRVEEIGEERLRIAISFPLNSKPRLARDDEPGWIASDTRFLNGTLVAVPVLVENTVVLRIEALEVPGKEVPPEFVEHLSPYRVTERYTGDPVLGPAMEKLTAVQLDGGRLTLHSVPGQTPAHIITDEEVDSASGRFFLILGIAALVFLLFVAVVLFIGHRAKGKAS